MSDKVGQIQTKNTNFNGGADKVCKLLNPDKGATTKYKYGRRPMLGRGVCVVFGGASGVGRKYVKEWAKSGRQVAYIDINKTSGRSLMEELGEECAKNVFFFHGDINNEEDKELFECVVRDRYGMVECFLNNIPSYKMNCKSSKSAN